MPDTPVTLAAIRETRGLLGDRIHHTPMLSSATAARFVEGRPASGSRTGGCTSRPSTSRRRARSRCARRSPRISSLTADERARGAITISAGNAGQAYAWAGREAGVPMTVVMPLARRRVEGRRLPRIRRGGRAPRRPTSASRCEHLERAARGAGLVARASVRRPRGPAGQRVVSASSSSTTCRTSTSSSSPSAAAASSAAWRRRSRSRGPGSGSTAWSRRGPTRCSAALAADEPVRVTPRQRRRRPRCAIGRPLRARRSPSATSTDTCSSTTPRSSPGSGSRRADEAGARAGGRDGPRRGPDAARSRCGTAIACASSSPAATSRRIGWVSCSPRPARSRCTPDRPAPGGRRRRHRRRPAGRRRGPPAPPVHGPVGPRHQLRPAYPVRVCAPLHRAARAASPVAELAAASRPRVPAEVLEIPLETRELVRASLDLLTRCDSGPALPVLLHRVHRAGHPRPAVRDHRPRAGPRRPGHRRLRPVRRVAAFPSMALWIAPRVVPGGDPATSSRQVEARTLATAVDRRPDRGPSAPAAGVASRSRSEAAFWSMFLGPRSDWSSRHRRHDRRAGRGLRCCSSSASSPASFIDVGDLAADLARDLRAVRVRAGRRRARRGGPDRGDRALVPARPPPGRLAIVITLFGRVSQILVGIGYRHGARRRLPSARRGRTWSSDFPLVARRPDHRRARVRPRHAHVRGRGDRRGTRGPRLRRRSRTTRTGWRSAGRQPVDGRRPVGAVGDAGARARGADRAPRDGRRGARLPLAAASRA